MRSGLRPRPLAAALGRVVGLAGIASLTSLAGCSSFAFRAQTPGAAPVPFVGAQAGQARAQSDFAVSPDSARGGDSAAGADFAGTADFPEAVTAAAAALSASAIEPLPAPNIELAALPPPRPGNLFVRLGESFSLPVTDDPAYERELEWFAGHPEYMQRVLERGSQYLYYIANQLYMRGMPAELALLPLVESAYDPFAYSRGRAEGLWQIIPGTARRLGIQQDWWFDGRRDLIESTRAALDYLQALHERFDGDWLLAIAGYNSGGGTVARALERARAAGRGTDFWSIRRYLPAETRTYVPRLLAISRLVAHPQRYGLELPYLADAPQIAVVDTGGQIDMARAAELAGLDVDDLYQLNPGFNRWATDPNGPHRLVLPLDKAADFRDALANLDDDQRLAWSRYRIAPGDTLIELAGKFRTTPDVLRQVNKLHGNSIRAGAYLMIPHAQGSPASYPGTVTARLARQQNTAHGDERREHVVASGESLWSISQRYGVSVTELAKWNGMAPRDTLSVGRKLVVWLQQQDQAAPAPQLTAVSQLEAGDGRIRRVNYVVRRGDSLAGIARRFRLKVGDLLKWNDGLSTKRYLHPGQQIVLFVNVTEQST